MKPPQKATGLVKVQQISGSKGLLLMSFLESGGVDIKDHCSCVNIRVGVSEWVIKR